MYASNRLSTVEYPAPTRPEDCQRLLEDDALARRADADVGRWRRCTGWGRSDCDRLAPSRAPLADGVPMDRRTAAVEGVLAPQGCAHGDRVS